MSVFAFINKQCLLPKGLLLPYVTQKTQPAISHLLYRLFSPQKNIFKKGVAFSVFFVIILRSTLGCYLRYKGECYEERFHLD